MRITRQSTGIFRVEATSSEDLYRGLGRCHGEDRAMQMLMLRILGRGRASEFLVADERMLGVDRFFRKMAFARGAEAEEKKLDPKERRLLDAYCQGVNESLQKKVPWEFKLLGYRPEPWISDDSMLLSRMIAFVGLAQSQGEIERLVVEMVQAGVRREQLEELFPGRLEGLDVELLKKVRLHERVVPEDVKWLTGLPKFVASNNWVIAGKKTASGKPILANDPHLEVNCLPAVWYECQLEVGGRYFMGAGMPGLPAVLIGRSPELSWGVTYSFMDGMDSWVEHVEDGKYRRGDAWRAFVPRREVIKRKKKEDVTLTFYENEHGVLDGDPVGGYQLATKWATSDESGAESMKAMLGILDARSVEEGRALLGRLESAWNWVLADSQGGIAYQMSGRMPKRKPGASGLVPLPGWEPENDWRGFAAVAELPRALNPAAGFFATANQDLNAHGVLKPITSPMAAWRADRINQCLAAENAWTVDKVRKLQTDVTSLQARAYLDVLLPLVPDSPEARSLKAWDCRYDVQSREATLFEAFFRELLVRVVAPVVGDDVFRHLEAETAIFPDFFEAFERVLLAEKSAWFGKSTRRALYLAAWEAARKAPALPWGEKQTITMTHMLFGGKLPAVFGFDKGPLPFAGGRGTVMQGQVFRSGGRVTSFGPSYRFVADMATDEAHTVLAGGTSDRRFAREYLSDFARWRAGELKKLVPGRDV